MESLELPESTVLAVSRSGELALGLGSHIDGIMTYGTLARAPAGGVPREVLEDVRLADWSTSSRGDYPASARVRFSMASSTSAGLL